MAQKRRPLSEAMRATTCALSIVFCALLLPACSGRSSGSSAATSQIMADFVISRTDQGVHLWRLKARQALLRSSGGDLDLETPEMEVFQEKKAAVATRVNSKTGNYHQETGDIHLNGDVVAVTQNEGEETTILKTDHLDYFSTRRQFETDQPVLITRGRSVIRGRGLRASHDLSEIHVLHQEARLQ